MTRAWGKNDVLAAAALVAAVFLTFWPCLANGYTNWDDNIYITSNPLLHDFTFAGIARIFNAPYEGLYTPLVILSFWVESLFFKLDPRAVHATNVVLHAANAVLVYALFAALSRRPLPAGQAGRAAFFAALFFALHPLRVEAVAWATARKDVLYGFFYLVSLVSWVRYREHDSRNGYMLSLVSYGLALLSKPMAVTLPLAILVIEWFFPIKRGGGSSATRASADSSRSPRFAVIGELAPFFVLGAVGVACALASHPAAHAGVFNTMKHPLLGLVYAPLFYLGKTLAPFGLSCLYPRPENLPVAPLVYRFGPAILALSAFLVWRARREWPWAAFAAVWFFATAWPILPVFRVSLAIVFDRYTYLTMLGVFWAVAEAGERLFERAGARGRTAGAVCGVVLAAAMAAASMARCPVWRDSGTLWTDVIDRYPHAWAYLRRGDYRSSQRQFKEAIADYDQSIRMRPDRPEGYNNRGAAYLALGDADGALADFSAAIEADPSYARAYANRAFLMRQRGEAAKSQEDMERALFLSPDGDFKNRNS